MADKDNFMPKDLYPVYKLGSVTYLPHYAEPDVFVGPGFGRSNFKKYNALELIRGGALPDKMYLFERIRDSKKGK